MFERKSTLHFVRYLAFFCFFLLFFPIPFFVCPKKTQVRTRTCFFYNFYFFVLLARDARSMCVREFLERTKSQALYGSGIKVRPIESEFCKDLEGRAMMIGTTICRSRRCLAGMYAESREVARARQEIARCCTSASRTIDAAEGGPTPCWCGCVSPLHYVASCVSLSVRSVVVKGVFVERQGRRSLLCPAIYVPSSTKKPRANVLRACVYPYHSSTSTRPQ